MATCPTGQKIDQSIIDCGLLFKSQLEILSNCSVFLASGSTPSCVPVNSTPTEPIPSKTEETVPVTTSGIPAIVDTEQQSGSGNTVMFISVAGAGCVPWTWSLHHSKAYLPEMIPGSLKGCA